MLGFIKKLFGIPSTLDAKLSDFELTFSNLKELGEGVLPQAGIVYPLLQKLSEKSSEEEVNLLIAELQNLRFASNTNSVFFFYFPIVSHILYFNPEYGSQLLHHLVGPIFANGTGDEESSEMIRKIQSSMDFKLKEHPNFLTKEGQIWVKNILPTMKAEIQQEIDVCKKELEG